MTDKKISELTSITGANVDDTTDELAIVDDSATQTKKITRAELFSGVDKISLSNKEKADLSNDGDLSFDSSQGLLVYRTQQGVSGSSTAVTVLDGANVAAGTGVGITNLGAGGTGTQTFTFSIGQAVGTSDSPTFAGIDVTGTVESTVSSTGDFNFNAISSGGGNYRIYPDDATTANPTWLHQSNSSEDQAWVIGGVERMRLDASGNLGLGTSSPGAVLDVASNNPTFRLSDEDNPSYSNIIWDGNLSALFIEADRGNQIANSSMRFSVDATERMRIDSSGNVGIGNTNPSEELDVTGSAAVSGTTKVGTGAGGHVNADDLVASKDQTNVGMSLLAEDATGVVRFYLGSQTDNTAAKIQHSESNDELTIQAAGALQLQSGGAVDRVVIDSSGNVGIGNSSPSVPLDVTGNAAVSGKAKVGTGVDGASNGDELVISKDQTNVGMSILAADATGICRILFGSQTSTNAAKIQHSESNSRLFVQAEGDIYFQTGGSGTTMTLNGSGDLDVTGALSKGSGSFKISHPLKPDTHHLVHSFIEGPQADNIYRGTVALVGGSATVNLDTAGRMSEGTFVALNGNVQCFTSNEQGWTAVRGKVEGNILTIEAQDAACTDTVSWMVVGERHDQHMIDTAWTDAQGRVITEPEKVEDTQEEAE